VSDRYQRRRERLRRALAKADLGSMLVTHSPNVTYLTGFTGSDSYLLIRDDAETLITDGRYTAQLAEECPGLDLHVRRPGEEMGKAVATVLRRSRLGRVGIEGDSMSVGLRETILGQLPKVELVTTSGLVETLRAVKDRQEVEEIRRAIWCAERAFGVVRASLRREQTEKEVADALEHQMRLFGARSGGFAAIVAVGARAALPHATPGGQQIGSGDFVLMDWGADCGLYKSDLTRVLVTGRIPPKLERLYGVVLRAQGKAIAAIRPGVAAAEVDRIARQIIAEAGFGRYFGHGLGHGLGLEVHEAPRLAASSRAVLKPGMVVTVEPGIYLPNWGGVRIEDDVLVTRNGHEVLTTVAKQWDQIVVH